MDMKKNEHGLTKRQDAFCSEYVRSGGKKEHSAIVAGYGKTSARTRAWELIQRDDIQQRIRDITQKTLSALGVEAISQLGKLMVSAQSESVKQACAVALADRAGYKHPEVIEVNDKRSMDEIDRELESLLQPPVDKDDEPQELH